MSEYACLTEAAHWLAFGEWGHDAAHYALTGRWRHDDPQGEQLFGSRRAAGFARPPGEMTLRALGARADPFFGASLHAEVRDARRMMAFTGKTAVELLEDIQRHYGPRVDAWRATIDRLQALGFTPLLRWIEARELTAFSVTALAAPAVIPPGAFAYVAQFDPAQPVLPLVQPEGGPILHVGPLVDRQDLEVIARAKGVTVGPKPSPPKRSPAVSGVISWAEEFHAEHGHLPSRQECRRKAVTENWSQQETYQIVAQLSDEPHLRRAPAGRRPAPKPRVN